MLEIKRKPQKPVTGAETPLKPIDGANPINSTHDAQNTQKRQLQPFTGLDPKRNYRAMYRAACEFHERHNPSRCFQGDEMAYWDEVLEDMRAVYLSFDGDPFMMEMLTTVFDELERELNGLVKGEGHKKAGGQ